MFSEVKAFRLREAETDRKYLTWLGWRDSNPRYQSQSLVCYHYTTSQYRGKINGDRDHSQSPISWGG